MAFKIPNFAKQMGGSPFHVTPDPSTGSSTKKSSMAAVGTEERKKQYDEKGWKYDDTIAGYNRDGSKKEEPKKEEPKKEEPKNEKKDHKPAEGVKVKSRKEKRAARRVARLSKKNKKKGLTKGQSKRLSRNISKAKGEKVKDEDKTNVGKVIKKGVDKVKKVVKKKDKETEE